MAKRWRTLLVGAGKMGRNHLRVLAEDPRFEVGAVVDPRAVELFPQPAFRTATNLDEVLDESWDCAVVAAPTSAHAEVARTILGRRIPLLIEKPLAQNPAECAGLVALSHEHRVPFCVGHLERFNPAIRKLAQVLRAGWIGEPIHFSFTRVGGYPEGIQDGNNVLLDLAVHDLDVLRSLIGPLTAQAAVCHSTWRAGVYDTAEILVSSEAGPSASIHVNWITPTKIRSVRVTGTRGVCFVDFILQSCQLLGGNLLHRSFREDHDYASLIEDYKASDHVEFEVVKREPLRVQLDEFHKLLLGEPSEACSGEEASAAVALVGEALRMAERFSHRSRILLHPARPPPGPTLLGIAKPFAALPIDSTVEDMVDVTAYL